MIVGIDLGTTNSLVGIWADGEAKLIPNALGELLTPSAVSLDRDGSVVVGRTALDRTVSHAALLARCGHALGWIAAAETRAFMFDLAREVSATFESWQDYAHDFEVGRAFWFGVHETEIWPPLLARLLADARSPWTRLPFVFPEDEASRAIGSADARSGPFWTLETLERRPDAASGPWAGVRA